MTQTEAVQLLNENYYGMWSFTTQGVEREVLSNNKVYYKVKADLHIAIRQPPITMAGMGFGAVDANTPEKHIDACNAALDGALVNAVQRLGLTSDKS